jgi:hypothetical protein
LIFPKLENGNYPAMAYPVQKSLWESLESVFFANAKHLLRDIALDMGRPEKELVLAFSKDKLKLYPVEEEAKETECCAIQTDSLVATRCRRAVYRDTCYCPLHLRTPPNSQFAYGYPQYRRIKTESGEIYFLDPITQLLYTKDLTRVGTRFANKIQVFKIEEPIENREETSDE